MEQNGNVHFNEQLRQRTMKMAAGVRNLLSSLNVGYVDKNIISQLIRSSTSVAANYRAASCGRSYSEFYSKICIVVEEADETKFWLEYLAMIGVLNESGTKPLRSEIDELVRLFSSIRSKVKGNLKNNGGKS